MRKMIEYFKSVKGNEVRYEDGMTSMEISEKIGAWMRRVAVGDINEALRVANESRKFFNAFMKQNPKAYEHFKRHHDRLAEAIMEKISGEKVRID